jgi:hypothetical protein
MAMKQTKTARNAARLETLEPKRSNGTNSGRKTIKVRSRSRFKNERITLIIIDLFI